MIALLILALGWPTLQTPFGPPRQPEANWTALTVSRCCGSMRPHLKGGELVYVSPALPGERLLGQIIATPDRLHMVTAENRTHVRTAGTANRHSDGWTPRTQIAYVVRYVTRLDPRR